MSLGKCPWSPRDLSVMVPLGRMVTLVMLPLARLIRSHASGGSCRALVCVCVCVCFSLGDISEKHCTSWWCCQHSLIISEVACSQRIYYYIETLSISFTCIQSSG